MRANTRAWRLSAFIQIIYKKLINWYWCLWIWKLQLFTWGLAALGISGPLFYNRQAQAVCEYIYSCAASCSKLYTSRMTPPEHRPTLLAPWALTPRLSTALCCWNHGHLQRSRKHQYIKKRLFSWIYSVSKISTAFTPSLFFFFFDTSVQSVHWAFTVWNHNPTHCSSSRLHTQSSIYSAPLLFLGCSIYSWLSSDHQNKFGCWFGDGHHRVQETVIRSRNSPRPPPTALWFRALVIDQSP